jgi:DNA-binding NtrC family response regulator
MMSAREILVVDDEIGIRELLRDILQDEGYQVRLAENAAEARVIRQQQRPDLVLLDIWMPDCDGISLLKEWGNAGLLNMPVVMMSGHGTIDTAVEATRIGAFDFLEKPIALQKLLKTVGDALKHAEQSPQSDINLLMLCKCQLMTELRTQLEKLANQHQSILLIGEQPSGAELFAKFFHRSNTPWVVLNDLSRLSNETSRLLEELQDGVLMLPELASLDRAQQKGLLVFLNKAEQFKVRVIAATLYSMQELSNTHQLDAQLLQRFAQAALLLPALNQYKDDIPDIARALGLIMVETHQLPYRDFDTAALNALRKFDWPNNFSQLSHMVGELLQFSKGERIFEQDVLQLMEKFQPLGRIASVAQSAHGINLDLPLREARDDFERLYFEHHIEKAERNMSKVAENVEMERTHLYRKLKQLGIKIK